MFIKRLYIGCLGLLLVFSLEAQVSGSKSMKGQKDIEPVKKAASKLSKSLVENEDEAKLAADYEGLAKELQVQEEYARAENYWKRAREIYRTLERWTDYYRTSNALAAVLEKQQKYEESIKIYEEAAERAPDKDARELNLNNAGRLQNRWKPEAQTPFIEKNIVILEQKGKEKEQAEEYKRLAETNVRMNRKEVALENYEKALKVLPESEKEAEVIKKDMAEVYVADQQFEKAIDINQELLDKATEQEDVLARIGSLRSLAENYYAGNRKKEAIDLLHQAYDLSVASELTLEARSSVDLLAQYYARDGRYKQSIELYHDFLGDLEKLIEADSTLVDTKIFRMTEEKIARLEKEKALKDELIKEKNTFNYVLILSVSLLLFLLFLIVKSFFSIKNKNKKIALQSLRREMNPHFIFNSLNSVNQFIAENNELEANKYLTSYSRLMRNMMENSNKDFIPLDNELELLNEYLALEQLRFADKFSYVVRVDESLDTDTCLVPNMLIQPQLENAVWHGLRYKPEKGLLQLTFMQQDGRLLVEVEDDGIGLSRSREMKTDHQKKHVSRGLTNIRERILLLNDLYKTDISLKIREKELPDTGVLVILDCGKIVYRHGKEEDTKRNR